MVILADKIERMRTCRFFKYVAALFILCAVTSCSQDEGFGGTSSVTGKVFVYNYNAELTDLIDTHYGMDEDVFIVFGDDVVYGEKTSTHYNGLYRFENLRKGQYTVYSYSEDTSGTYPGGTYPVLMSFEITENGQEIILDDIIIVK